MMLRKIICFESAIRIISLRYASTKPQKSKEPTKRDLLLKLRNSTGYPLINCKDALAATDYNVEKAKDYLINLAKEKGWNKMQDISQKLNQGLIGIAKNKTTAAIVEINCGTDFVAKTQDFQLLVKETADVVLWNFSTERKTNIPVEEVLDLSVSDENLKLQDKIAIAIGKLREAVVLRRACVLSAPSGGTVASYVHPSSLIPSSKPGSTLGTFASLATISCTNDERTPTYIKTQGRNLCQHIVGMRPTKVGEETKLEDAQEIDENLIEIDSQQEEGMKSNVMISAPDMSSDELLRQPFLLDSDISVEQWLSMSDIKVHDFIRFQVADYSEKLDKQK